MTFFAKFCIPFIVGAVVMFAIVLINYFSWLRNLPKSDLKLIAKGIFTPTPLRPYGRLCASRCCTAVYSA